MHTFGGLLIASGSSAWWNTDSLKATKGGETCSSTRAKRSRRSLMIVSRWTSPAGGKIAWLWDCLARCSVQQLPFSECIMCHFRCSLGHSEYS